MFLVLMAERGDTFNTLERFQCEYEHSLFILLNVLSICNTITLKLGFQQHPQVTHTERIDRPSTTGSLGHHFAMKVAIMTCRK